MKHIKLFEEFVNESYKINDFPEGSLITFKDKEVWRVVKAGMRRSNDRVGSDEITIKPYNDLAKDKNVSMVIDVNLDFLNANVKKIKQL